MTETLIDVSKSMNAKHIEISNIDSNVMKVQHNWWWVYQTLSHIQWLYTALNEALTGVSNTELNLLNMKQIEW